MSIYDDLRLDDKRAADDKKRIAALDRRNRAMQQLTNGAVNFAPQHNDGCACELCGKLRAIESAAR